MTGAESSRQQGAEPENAQQTEPQPFVIAQEAVPLKRAKIRAFDSPTMANLDALVLIAQEAVAPRERGEPSRQPEPLLELFQKYGGHWLDCPAVARVARAQLVEGPDGELQTRRFATRSEKPCSCGFDAAIESLKLGERGEWQPIETADQDTPVLLYTPPEALYKKPRGRQADFRIAAPRFWTWATHWQPPPAPPAPSAEDEK